MELGQRLKQARLEAGLSQRQLCADLITRNMLSQIENGSARPSMDTLCALAGRLGKPVSFFLNEDTAAPNQQSVVQARNAFSSGNYGEALALLADYADDGVFDAEAHLVQALCCLTQAQAAIEQGRLPYAKTLLQTAQEAGEKTPYYTQDLERHRLLLLAQCAPEMAKTIVSKLDYRELLLRGQVALAQGDFPLAAALLDAVSEPQQECWCILRGDIHFAAGEIAQAAQYYLMAEGKCFNRLERCYEKLGDYQKAYY